jgi:hypothetical protein
MSSASEKDHVEYRSSAARTAVGVLVDERGETDVA